MTTWLRQHRESPLYRAPWHPPEPVPTQVAMLGLRVAARGTTTAREDRDIDRMEDPLLDDRRPACQGAFMRDEVA